MGVGKGSLPLWAKIRGSLVVVPILSGFARLDAGVESVAVVGVAVEGVAAAGGGREALASVVASDRRAS